MICQRDRPQAYGDALFNEGIRPLGTRSLDIRGRRRHARFTGRLA